MTSIALGVAAQALLKQRAPEEHGTVSWEHGHGAFHAPALVPDGIAVTIDHHLDFLDRDGKSHGSFDAGCDISAPASGPNGTAAVCSADGRLLSIKSDGKLNWQISLPVDASRPPARGVNGDLYAVGKDGHLYAVDGQGHLRWDKKTRPWLDLDGSPDRYSPPITGGDGSIVVANRKKYITAFNPDGSKKWRHRLPGELCDPANAAVDEHGNVAIPAYFDSLLLLDNRGHERWHKTVGPRLASTPAFGPDGAVYVGDDHGILHVYGPDGTPRPGFRADSKIMVAPAIAPDGSVTVCSWLGHVYHLSPGSTTPSWTANLGGLLCTAPRQSEDTIYVSSAGGSVVALREHTRPTVQQEIAEAVATPPTPAPGTVEELDGWVAIGDTRVPLTG